jgi:tetratricopeptide (TPR) repeat protein
MKSVLSTKFIIVLWCGIWSLYLGFLFEVRGIPLLQVLVTALIPLIPVIYIITQARILYKIPETFSAPERIHKLSRFIKRNTVRLRLPFVRPVRRHALILLARAHADVGDYGAVYRTYADIVPLHPRGFTEKALGSRLDAEFYAAMIEAFIHSNRHKAAEEKLNQMLGKIFTDDKSNCLVKYTYAYFLTHTGGIDGAREAIAELRKFPDASERVHYLEAVICKLEKNMEGARAEFSYLAENCRDYGITRKAKEELEYWITRF